MELDFVGIGVSERHDKKHKVNINNGCDQLA